MWPQILWQRENANEIMSSLHLKPTNASIILRIKSTSLTMACKALCGLLHCSFPGLISYHFFPCSLFSRHAYCLDFLPTVWAHFYITGLSISTTYFWKTLLSDLHSFTSFKFLCKHLFKKGTAWQPSLIDRHYVLTIWNYLVHLFV